ncbi:MAG: DUF2490 domain-containing protein [Sediminicola sp.]|tara:strand:- start:159539 stop:160231 length:693 start_codon:yes stop_codon:yes gene_type:complete
MTISFIRQIPVLFPLLLIPAAVFSQGNFTAYWEPQVAINYGVTPTYSHNFSIGNRNYVLKDGDLQVSGRQVDIAHFSNLQVFGNQSIALGVQYRFRSNFGDGGNNELRLTQQYNITHGAEKVRYGHRLRTEQRITKSSTIHRFRYRGTVDFPLNGLKLDVGEPYFAGSLESLLSVSQHIRPNYDQRFSTTIGWLLNEHTKIQGGLEYRLENYTHATEQVFFIQSSLVLSF